MLICSPKPGHLSFHTNGDGWAPGGKGAVLNNISSLEHATALMLRAFTKTTDEHEKKGDSWQLPSCPQLWLVLAVSSQTVVLSPIVAGYRASN